MSVEPLPGRHEALVRHDRSLRRESVPTRMPARGGCLIAPQFVGICGTDLQILNGARPDTARILGHEGIGIVVRAGTDSKVSVGEHVVFNPTAELDAGMILGHNTPGLFQRYVAVSTRAIESGLLLLVDEFPVPVCGALVEPLAAVLYGCRLMVNVRGKPRTVAVFGAGPMGLLTTIYLMEMGVKVLLIHPHGSRFKTVTDLRIADGVDAIVDSANCDRNILERSGGGVDSALIATTRAGAPAALKCALNVVTNGGCVDLIANYPEAAAAPPGIDALALRAVRGANICGTPAEGAYLWVNYCGRRLALIGHRGTSRADLCAAIETLRRRHATYSRIVTHVLSWHEAASAIQRLSESRERSLRSSDCIKAVVDVAPAQSQEACI